MKSPITIITKAGLPISLEEWQKLYGLTVGSDEIGKFFTATEARFAKDIQLYHGLIVNELLMRVLDKFRETVKKPININSFNRDEKKQNQLKEDGFRTATFSPHVVKMAADIDTESPEETRAWVFVLQRCSTDINIKIRIGSEQYLKVGQTFIHVDVCPEYYAPGKPLNKTFHPVQWEKVITW